jgi:hypothetical protein
LCDVVASAITTVSAAVFYGLVAFSVRQRGLADAVLSAGDLFERVEMRRQRDYYGAAMRSLPDVCHLLAGYARSNPPSTSSEKEAVMPGALTHWEPFAELGELRSRFDRMSEERKHSNTSAITRPNITYKNDANTELLPSSTEPATLRAQGPQNARYHLTIEFWHPTGWREAWYRRPAGSPAGPPKRQRSRRLGARWHSCQSSSHAHPSTQ